MPQANNIVKDLSPEFFDQKHNAITNSQGMQMTKPLSNALIDVVGDQSHSFERQKAVEWADELRKADQRCEEFQKEISGLQKMRDELSERARFMESQVSTRDQEIERLGGLY